MHSTKKIEISHSTILFIFGLLIGLWLFAQVWDIFLLFFVSVIIMAALKPVIDLLERKRIPRGVAIGTIYALLWIVMGGLIATIVPPLIVQTRNLAAFIPPGLEIGALANIQFDSVNQVLNNVGSLPENIFRAVIQLFGNIVNFVTTLVVSFYLLVERKNLDKHLSSLAGRSLSRKVSACVNEIELKLGHWVRGEIILMTVIGVGTYIGLVILGINSALPLAILAGLMEVIPNIGPIISSIPAIIIAFFIHPLLAVSTAALYFLIQFLENNLVVPQVMKKVTGVNPLMSLIGLMIGVRFAGAAGALLSIPMVLVIQTIVEHFVIIHIPPESSQ